MKVKVTVLFLLLVGTLQAEVLAKVDVFGGVRVFTECTPVANYEILGTISYSVPDGVLSLSQYTEIRDGLVAQSVLANREVNGIIINGKKATLLKIAADDPNAEFGTPNKRGSVYIFIDSKPLNQYEFVSNVNAKLFSISSGNDGHISGVLNSILKRASKLKQPYNGAIMHFVTGGKDWAEMIQLKD